MKLLFQCTRRNESLNGEQLLVELTMSPVNAEPHNYGIGAAIGTPNAPNPMNQRQDVFRANPSAFNINLSGTSEELAAYQVGKTYSFTLDVEKPTKSEEQNPEIKKK